MNRMRALALAVLFGGATTLLGYGVTALGAGASDDQAALGPGLVTVPIDIEHSRFGFEVLRVRTGTLVRFVVHNADPINHELVIGDEAVHARHSRGTEASHPPVPGEVSIGPGETGVTTFVFDEPGTVTFACHLRGHVEYGMIGEITVEERNPPRGTRD